MKSILTVLFLGWTATTYAQIASNEVDYVVHPKCVKEERKGKEIVEQCFFRNLVEDVSAKTMYLLQVNKIAYIDLKTQVKFTINEEGEFENLEYFGSEINKKIVEESFERYLMDYSKKKKKIVSAKDAKGLPIKKSYYIPFHVKKGYNDFNQIQAN